MKDFEFDVSIIIVNWNTRSVLQTCLRSVVSNLSGVSAELIVVDNGSTDGSPEMVSAEFPSVRLIANTDNRGFAAANNQGFQVARGKHVLLLNSDTEVLGDVIQKSLAYLEQYPQVGVMGCRVLNSDRSVQLTCSQFPSLINLGLLASGLSRFSRPKFCGRYQLRSWNRDSERDVDTVTGCYMLVRREALDEVGTLDEDFFFYGEETDWCKRFIQAGWILRFAPVGEIIHHGSLSSRRCNHRRDLMLTSGLLRFHHKHGGPIPTAVAWVILAVFCVLRSIYWTIHAAWSRTDYAIQRRGHFFHVLRDFKSVWPSPSAVRP
ncbi:MAG: glycosyltransferase family 2 protein [Planctomycetota bacterium]